MQTDKVTSVHYDAPPELITLLLEKGASLSSRHLQWVFDSQKFS